MNTKRLLRCLKRIQEGKSKPDFDAVFELDDIGYISISGSSDDLTITITHTGESILKAAEASRNNAESQA